MNEDEIKLREYLIILNEENPTYKKENVNFSIINLFEKQQKEIEELKAITREYEAYKVGEGDNIVIASKNWFDNGYFKENYISKNKIKEIISKYVDIEEHLVYHHKELWRTDLAEMIKELLGE